MAQRNGGGSSREQSTWRCSACGCNRNKLSRFWCKHCGTKWQKQGAWQNEDDGLRLRGIDRHQQPLRPGLLAAGAPPQTGAAAIGGARDGAVQPGLSAKDLTLLINLTGRAGDKESVNKYQEQLSKLTARPVAPIPLEQRVAQCQRERLCLAKKLQYELDKLDNLESEMEKQRLHIASISDQLTRQEESYAELVDKLASVARSDTPAPEAPRINIEDLVAGKFDASQIDLGKILTSDGGENEYELPKEYVEELDRRQKQLAEGLSELSKRLFAEALDHAKALVLKAPSELWGFRSDWPRIDWVGF
ncbi:unnamed protein product [Prorocentrum cordatum]|uniref:RanBP2-type domain-containing protein n=1 Tax=Prorocentrum cordatum TaxID=2364126 RepID=A0ABN9WYE0_9DINO|nr:unnamed protein product [Polarella glacialis]